MSDPTLVPDDFPTLSPMLICGDVSAEVDFCRAAFGAIELNRRLASDGSTAHALLAIGEARVMIESLWPGIASRPPHRDGTSPVVLFLYVEDVDATVGRAVAAGARILMPVADRFWGDRTGRILAPAGHVWTSAGRIEDLSVLEREARWARIAEST